MGIYVTFWGVRGSIPTPGHATQRYGGNTACIEVRVDDTLFVLDGGSGLRPMGAAMAARGEMAVHAHMFFSHSHWDHIQGFPFFTPAYCPETILRVYGTAAGDQGIFDILNGQMQDKYFPVQFSDLGARVIPDHLDGGDKRIGAASVNYLDTCHPGGSLAFSISAYDRKVVYSTDNELDLVLENKEESLAFPNALRKFPQHIIDFMEGSDLLIADGQYTEEEYKTKINWGHPRATTLVDLAMAANIKRLAVTHHDPMQTDDDVDAKVQQCRDRAATIGYTGMIFGAREGITLKL